MAGSEGQVLPFAYCSREGKRQDLTPCSDGEASACCAVFQEDSDEGAVEAHVVRQLMAALRHAG